MLTESLPRIRILQAPTSMTWVEFAIRNWQTVLLDHSHCERKAAGVALNLLFRYPSSTRLIEQLTAIAQEELDHFAQVNRLLAQRGIALAPLNAPPYGAALGKAVRRQEPERMLDSLLVAALIEARSHERLGLLAKHCPDSELADFWGSLVKSEARHYGIYWVLAEHYYERDTVQARLQELAVLESDLLQTLHWEPRMHS